MRLWHTRRVPKPLIATDLDGTLLMTGSQTIHDDAKAAVHQAIAAGIPVVFATGRAPVDIVPIAELVGHRWYAVCNDGAALVDLAEVAVMETFPISVTVLNDVVAILRASMPDVKFLIDRVAVGPILEDQHGLIIEEGFLAPWATALTGAQEVSDIVPYLNTADIVKLCAFVDRPGDEVEGFEHIVELVHDRVTCVRIQSDKTFVDMTSLGVSKATGVSAIADRVGIGRDHVFAVGDLHNDAELLDWAGFSFAVANAHPTIQEIADVIVPSNDEGGVARVIKQAMDYLSES